MVPVSVADALLMISHPLQRGNVLGPMCRVALQWYADASSCAVRPATPGARPPAPCPPLGPPISTFTGTLAAPPSRPAGRRRPHRVELCIAAKEHEDVARRRRRRRGDGDADGVCRADLGGDGQPAVLDFHQPRREARGAVGDQRRRRPRRVRQQQQQQQQQHRFRRCHRHHRRARDKPIAQPRPRRARDHASARPWWRPARVRVQLTAGEGGGERASRSPRVAHSP